MVTLWLLIKIIDITMNEHYLDGTDEIKVFQLIVLFITAGGKQNILERKAYLIWPRPWLGGPALSLH